MSNDIIEGIIRHTRNEIEKRITEESQKIVEDVIMKTMKAISIEQYQDEVRYQVNLVFKFKGGEAK